jgi:hypothetical protein
MTDVAARRSIVADLAGFPARLVEAVRAVPDRPVADEAWGPVEVVRHHIAVETDVHQARLADLARTGTPGWQWEEPGPWWGEPGLTQAELLDRFGTLRAATLRTVDGLDAAGWSRSGVHAVLGPLDVRGLLANAVDHDRVHLADLASR